MAEYKGKEIVVTPQSSKENEIEAKKLQAKKSLINAGYGVTRFLPWIKYVTDIGDIIGVTDNPDASDMGLLISLPYRWGLNHGYKEVPIPENLKGDSYMEKEWKHSNKIMRGPAKVFGSFLGLPGVIGDVIQSSKDFAKMFRDVDDYRRAVGISDEDAKAAQHFTPLSTDSNNTYDILGYKVGGQFTFPTNLLTKNQQYLSNTKRKRNTGIPKSSRPMLNPNRIVRGQEGLKFGSFKSTESVGYDISLLENPALKMDMNTQYSDLKKYKPLNLIMEEVLTPLSNLKKSNFSLNSTIQRYLGIPYVFGGKSEKGIDCSGFTSKVMLDLGYDISGGSELLWNLVDHINVEDLLPGDLVFLKGTIKGRASDKTSHVAIVTDVSELNSGKIKVAEASGKGKVSVTDKEWDLTKGFYRDHWLGAGRAKMKV